MHLGVIFVALYGSYDSSLGYWCIFWDCRRWINFGPLGDNMDPLFLLRFTFRFLVVTLSVVIIVAFFVLFVLVLVLILVLLFVAFVLLIPFLSMSSVSHLGLVWDSAPNRPHVPHLQVVFPHLCSGKRPQDEVGMPVEIQYLMPLQEAL